MLFPLAVMGTSGCVSTRLIDEINLGNETRALQIIETEKGLEDRDEQGFTPLHLSIGTGNEAIAEALLKRNADVNAKSFEGATPLHLLAESPAPQPDLLDLLLRDGAAANAKNNLGQTPLHVLSGTGPAYGNGNMQAGMMRKLISAGARVNEPDREGMTPLHLAGKSGQNAPIIDLLLSAGADLEAKNKYGYTPLHLAVENNHAQTAAYLLKVGAEPALVEENLSKTSVPWGEYDIRHNYFINGKTYQLAGAWREGEGNGKVAREYYEISQAQFKLAAIEYNLWAGSFEKWIKNAKSEKIKRVFAELAVTAASMASGVPVSFNPEWHDKVRYFKTSAKVYRARARNCEILAEKVAERENLLVMR